MPAWVLEQSMDRRSAVIGRFLEPLRRASGRCREPEPQSLPRADRRDRAHDRRLADARPAGDDAHRILERVPDRTPLLFGKLEPRALRERGELVLDVEPERLARCAHQHRQHARDSVLRGVQRARVDAAGHLVAHHPSLPFEHRQCLGDRLRRQLEQPRRAFDELPLGQETVAVPRPLRQRVQQTRPDARGRVVGEPDVARELVRRVEADADHLVGQPVRVRLQDRRCPLAEPLDDPRRQAGTEAVRPQEHHHLLDVLLRPYRRNQLVDPLRAEPLHLAQPIGLLLDDPQRVRAEPRDDALGGRRPDPAHQARRQVRLDAGGAGRQHGLDGVDLDLLAEPRMDVARPAHPNLLPLRELREGPDERERTATDLRPEPDHRETRIGVAVGEPLDGPEEAVDALAFRRLVGASCQENVAPRTMVVIVLRPAARPAVDPDRQGVLRPGCAAATRRRRTGKPAL